MTDSDVEAVKLKKPLNTGADKLAGCMSERDVSDERRAELILNPFHRMARSFDDYEKAALYHILRYYNNSLFVGGDGDDSFRLGQTRPPSFRRLVGHESGEMQGLRKARERLVEHDIIKSDPVHICRTAVDFAPTERGRKVLDELYGEAFEEIHGDELLRYEAIETESVLGGEQNEGLAHRYGVYQFYYGYVGDRTLYPQGPGPQPDFRVSDNNGQQLFGEVFTGHNDYQQVVEKYEAFAARDWPVVWLFPDAEIAARTINLLERRAENFHCKNAPFSNPGNYRPNRLNDYVSRPQSSTPGMGKVHTFASLYDQRIPASSN